MTKEIKYEKKVIIFLNKEEKSVSIVSDDGTSEYVLDYVKSSSSNGHLVNYWYLKDNADYDFMAINVHDDIIMFLNKSDKGGLMYRIEKFTSLSKGDIEKLFK